MSQVAVEVHVLPLWRELRPAATPRRNPAPQPGAAAPPTDLARSPTRPAYARSKTTTGIWREVLRW